jgi:hypothetical protein
MMLKLRMQWNKTWIDWRSYWQSLKRVIKQVGAHVSLFCTANWTIIVVVAGKFSEAEVMYTAAWEIQKQRFGINDIESLSTMHTLGALMESEERLEEARSMYEQCQALKVSVFGAADDSTLLTQHSLAMLELKGECLDFVTHYFGKRCKWSHVCLQRVT